MVVALKKDCFFRQYGEIGYLVRPSSSIDKVVNDSGSVFCNVLTREPQSIDDLVEKIKTQFFPDVEKETIYNDALEFYSNLAKDNFLNMFESLEEYREEGFSYSTLKGKMDFLKINSNLEEPTSIYLGEYFMIHPCLESFHIELTSKCNERCIHCYIPHQYKNTDIDPELMKSVLKQCREMNTLTVVFSGGEPMLHPNFIEFVKLAKDLDLNVTVLSNLTLLDEDILYALKYKNDAGVNVSLYSMQPDIHDAITTKKGSFEKTKKNIEKLINNNVPVQINCPVMKQNADSFDEVVRWGQKNKCMVNVDLEIMARYDHTTDNLKNRLDANEMKKVIYKELKSDIFFQKNILKSRSKEELSLYNVKPEDRVCGVGMSTLCMISSGDVYPCAGWQLRKCGNLNTQKLKDIWENSAELNYLRKLRMKDFEKCVNCSEKNYCKMCMSRNSNESPDGNIFDIPKITCQIAKLQKEFVEKYRQIESEKNY